MQLLSHTFEQVGWRKPLPLNLVLADVPKPRLNFGFRVSFLALLKVEGPCVEHLRIDFSSLFLQMVFIRKTVTEKKFAEDIADFR